MSKWYSPENIGAQAAGLANLRMAQALRNHNRSIIKRILFNEFGFIEHKEATLAAMELYRQGKVPPNFPVPALDYYGGCNPIGDMMELAYPIEIQLKFRG